MKGSELAKLLMRAHLGGVIEECVLCNDNNKSRSFISSVDLTNSLFLYCSEPTGIRFTSDLGIGNIALLINFLEVVGEDEVAIQCKENRLIITHKEKGEMQYLLTDPSIIPTTVPDGLGSISKLVSSCDVGLSLTSTAQKTCSVFLNLLKPGTATFVVGVKEILFTGGLESDHQFKVSLGVPTFKANKLVRPFSVKVYAKFLTAVFQVLEFGEKSSIKILFKQNSPVVIKQDDNNLWALVPVE